MPKINLRLTDEEHALLKEWALGSHRSIQREAVFRLFDYNHYTGPIQETVGVLPEREVVGVVAENSPTAERAQKAEGGDSRTPDLNPSRSESTPKKRMHPCKHHLPPSKRCPYGCDG